MDVTTPGVERMNRKVNHLKDELRRTFTMYALIPTFIISIFIFVLAFLYWNTNVVEQNQNRLNITCNLLTTTATGLMEKANDIAALCDIDELRDNTPARMQMYESLYRYTNSLGLQTEFYLYDEHLNRLISNREKDPEFVEVAKAVDWGIVGQFKRKPTVPNIAFTSSIKGVNSSSDLVVGKAILEKGKVTGYVIFLLPDAQVLSLVTNPYVDIVIKDKFDYAYICTDPFFSDAMKKLKPEIARAEGYLPVLDRKYYINKGEILNGELTVYTLTSIAGIVGQLINTLLMLVGVLIILSVSIVISVKKQVEEKTRMIDQLVEAFSAVKSGNLEMRLDINTNNEFQIISEAYNMMLCSLKDLMQTNHDKARATIISEIKQLESQFNPHFLFNTLENIKFMIKLDPAAANKMIVVLSNLLRYSINNDSSEVTIQEDIAYTQNYLEIQKYRFGNKLNYDIQIPESLNACLIPKLIIQPIIENAVKYGFRTPQHMLVEIDITIVDNLLVIKINNNGNEIDEPSLNEIRTMLASTSNSSQHSGLYNVNRRIQLMYGESFGLNISSSRQAGTTVKLFLPIQHKKLE